MIKPVKIRVRDIKKVSSRLSRNPSKMLDVSKLKEVPLYSRGRGSLNTRRPLYGKLYGRSRSLALGIKGRYIRAARPTGRIPPSLIAVIPTVKTVAMRSRGKFPVRVTREDIRVKINAIKRKFIIMLVVDTSESMSMYLRAIAQGLPLFHKIAWRMRDKVGLIICSGDEARIIHHPTSNLRVISRSIFRTKYGGMTPLASGLFKAFEVLRKEKRKDPSAITAIVLISDGIANIELKRPPNKFTREIIYSEAQADTIAVAKLLAAEKIPIIAINPMHMDKWDDKHFISPTELLKTIVAITNGRYFGFKMGLLAPPKISGRKIVDLILKALYDISLNYQS